jgi:hypothetical protein
VRTETPVAYNAKPKQPQRVYPSGAEEAYTRGIEDHPRKLPGRRKHSCVR